MGCWFAVVRQTNRQTDTRSPVQRSKPPQPNGSEHKQSGCAVLPDAVDVELIIITMLHSVLLW